MSDKSLGKISLGYSSFHNQSKIALLFTFTVQTLYLVNSTFILFCMIFCRRHKLPTCVCVCVLEF